MGGWADVNPIEPTTNTSNPVYYKIGSYRGGFLTYNGSSTNVTHEDLSYDALWYFMTSSDGFYMIPAADPTKKLATHSSATSDGATWYISENEYNSGYFCISLTNNFASNCLDANNSNTGVGYWRPSATDYAGTSWSIVKVKTEELSVLLDKAKKPNIPANHFFEIAADPVTSVTSATSAEDNDHWYLLTQERGGESPIYSAGFNQTIMRAASEVTPSSLNGVSATENAKYLVRFFSAEGDDIYNIQFGSGWFVDASLKSSRNAANYAFYRTTESSEVFGWNLNSKEEERVDNNGAGSAVVFWGSGINAETSGNNVWKLYPVTLSDGVYVIYNVLVDGKQKASETVKQFPGTTITIPESLNRDYCTYAYYSDEACTTPISEVPTSGTTVYVKAEPNLPIKYTEDSTAPYYYNLNIRSKYLMYSAEATGEVQLTESSEPFREDASWAFIGDPFSGFNIINKSKGTNSYLTYTSVVTGGNQNNNNIQFIEKDNATDKTWIVSQNNNGFVLRMKENTDIYFHHDSGINALRTCSKAEWSYVHTDAGSTLVAITDDDALYSLYEAMKKVSFGSKVNQYQLTSTTMTNDQARQAIESVGQIIANQETSNYADAYNSLKTIHDNIALNLPSSGFYRIKGKTSGTYLAAGNASNGKFNMSTATDANTIFYYSGTILTSFGSGMSNGMSSNSWEWVLGENASEVEFQDGLTNGGYGIKSSDANFYDNGDNDSADRGGNVTISANTDARYTKWYLEEVTELPITLNSAGDGYYATLYLPVDATITNADAFTIKVNEAKNAANTTQLEGGKVPANTPVLLKGTSSSAIAILNNGDAYDPADSDLTGTLVAITANGSTDYFLGKNTENQVGFYHWSGTVLKGFRAYLVGKVSGTSAKGFTLVFDEATGINTIENGKWTIENENVYNLQGQKVNRAQKGVYIVNGKKVVMK